MENYIYVVTIYFLYILPTIYGISIIYKKSGKKFSLIFVERSILIYIPVFNVIVINKTLKVS